MPNQTDYDRVNSHMIAPICVMFGAKFADEMIEAYVEDLASYSPDVLRAAFKALRRECKRVPTLAQVIEHCETQRKLIPSNTVVKESKRTGFHCTGHAEVNHPIQAREIMESAAGRMALEVGVARELIVEYEVSGKKDFDERDVRKFKLNLDESITALREAREIKNNAAEWLESMFNESQNREKRLYEKYYRKQIAA